MLTVRELIKQLKKENPERIVLLSSDEEGNSYKPLYEAERAAAKDEDGEWVLGIEQLTAELLNEGFTEDDVLEHSRPALVLYPE